MSFEIEGTVLYILLFLAIQIGLAGVIVLLWLFRCSTSRQKADKLPGTCFYGGLRTLRFLAVFGAGLSVVGVLTYLFFRPTEPQVSTYYQTQQVTSAADPEREEDLRMRDEQATESPFDEPWRGEKGAGDSRIRETVRKTIQGDLPSSAMVVNPIHNPGLNTYLGLINSWLDEAPKSRKSQPQLVDSLYDRLVKEYGFQGPKSLLAEYLASRQTTEKESSSKGLVFLQPGCGKEAQVRWWRKDMTIAGAETPVFFFSMESAWSRCMFVRAFTQGTLQTFFDAHLLAFRYFGGTFQQISYLDLPPPILDVLQQQSTESNEEFSALAIRYNFKAELVADPGERVKLVDEKLAKLNPFATIDQLNEKLSEILQPAESMNQDRCRQLFEAERLCLQNLPG